MIRPRLRIPRVNLARPVARRSIHNVPPLSHDFREGVPGLLSAEGFQMAWTDYMGLMLQKLNALTAGTELEQKDLRAVLLATAREPSKAPIFNHASMAHNNHFFFQSICPNPGPMPEKLRRALEQNFSSIETLRRELILTASSMFGPGFVWLVKDTSKNDFRILTTYLAGSPYSGAHWRRQGVDMNTLGGGESGRPGGAVDQYLQRQAIASGKGGADAWKKAAPGGVDVVPLLCLNTWEHVWLRDYGIGGKRAFAEAWWDAIDWEPVANAANINRPAFQ